MILVGPRNIEILLYKCHFIKLIKWCLILIFYLEDFDILSHISFTKCLLKNISNFVFKFIKVETLVYGILTLKEIEKICPRSQNGIDFQSLKKKKITGDFLQTDN